MSSLSGGSLAYSFCLLNQQDKVASRTERVQEAKITDLVRPIWGWEGTGENEMMITFCSAATTTGEKGRAVPSFAKYVESPGFLCHSTTDSPLYNLFPPSESVIATLFLGMRPVFFGGGGF